jgi:misacylated tRNA(Ala) deacylase
MTKRLFLEDATATENSAVVVEILPTGIVLDQTVFYARSGGQPGDSGMLSWRGGEVAITEAIKGDGETILHVPQAGADLPPVGSVVTATLEWPKRYARMRMHTALHLLCAALPGISVTGGSIGEAKSRLDMDMAEPPVREALEAALNALIAGDHEVSAYWVDESVLDTNPSLVRTLSVQPPRGTGRLRLVRIGAESAPIDLQPCGGTHVSRTGEIGAMRIAKIENKGRQNRRIVLEFAT